MNILESYHQTCTYDTGNNLIILSHQAQSNTWQQNISIHPNNNRGTVTKSSTTDFDANGNLLTLNNIGTLDWHYNNTLNKLNKLTKDVKTTEYYVYDYQGNRVRTVLESSQHAQSQRGYLPLLDISTNEKNQATNTLHIGNHIFSETTKDINKSRYQLSSHLQSNTLELNDKAKVISYEHFYPYGGTAIIAGKDQTQVQQKRYRYTGKERDDSSGLSYYGARYLAPWMARWISPDSAGAVDGLNLYVYVGNNPLKYIDPTGHIKTKIQTIVWDKFMSMSNKSVRPTSELMFWVGEQHNKPEGKKLLLDFSSDINDNLQNLILENTQAKMFERAKPISSSLATKTIQQLNISDSLDERIMTDLMIEIYALTEERYKGYFIGRDHWGNPLSEYQRLVEVQGLKSNSLALVGAVHLLTNKINPNSIKLGHHSYAYSIHDHLNPDGSIALVPQNTINANTVANLYRTSEQTPEYGMWVFGKDYLTEGTFLAFGEKHLMQDTFKDVVRPIPVNLSELLPASEILQAVKQQEGRCAIL